MYVMLLALFAFVSSEGAEDQAILLQSTLKLQIFRQTLIFPQSLKAS